MAKKKKIDDNSEQVANSSLSETAKLSGDLSKVVVTVRDNQQLAVARCDHKNIDIKSMIRDIRGQQVMLDSDLAMLYGVKTSALNQAVKRNINRFPDDFMFQLTKSELEALRSQNVTSNFIENQKNMSLTAQNVILKKGRGQHTQYMP